MIERTIGDRSTLAIEYHLDPASHASPRQWWGGLWMWVNGQAVGDPGIFEEVAPDLGYLAYIAGREAARYDAALPSAGTGTSTRPSVREALLSMEPDRAIDTVLWGRYGEPSPVLTNMFGDGQVLWSFEILPYAGAFFVDWEGILLENGSIERFLYRRTGERARSAVWRRGAFRRITREAKTEFDRVTRANE